MKKNIRFIAVDADNQNVQNFMSNSQDNYTELDSNIFSRNMDPTFTNSFGAAFKFQGWIGKLKADPEWYINHSQNYKFVSATIIGDNVFTRNGETNRRGVPLQVRLSEKNPHVEQFLQAKQGDTLIIDGYINSWVTQDPQDSSRPIQGMYASISGFSIVRGSTVRKQVKAKFEPAPKKAQAQTNDKLQNLLANLSDADKEQLIATLSGNQNGPTKAAINSNQTAFENTVQHELQNNRESEDQRGFNGQLSDEQLRAAMGDAF